MKLKRFLKRRRGLLSAASLVLLVVLVFAAVCSPLAVQTAATDRQLPVYCVKRDDKCVSLTFDAAWGNCQLGRVDPQQYYIDRTRKRPFILLIFDFVLT